MLDGCQAAKHRGIEDEHVERAPPLPDGLGELGDGSAVGKIHRRDCGIAAGVVDALLDRF